MIINKEELREAILKQLEGETVRLEVEVHLQKPAGREAEGLLAVTPSRLLFSHRPPFGEPEVTAYSRAALSITDRKEDLWGASMKAGAGDDSFELRRVAPPDFKQLCEELEAPRPKRP